MTLQAKAVLNRFTSHQRIGPVVRRNGVKFARRTRLAEGHELRQRGLVVLLCVAGTLVSSCTAGHHGSVLATGIADPIPTAAPSAHRTATSVPAPPTMGPTYGRQRSEYVNQANKCSVMPVSPGLLIVYRVTSCWVWAAGHPRKARMFFLGRRDGSPVLISGNINGKLYFAWLSSRWGPAHFDKVTASCVTLSYQSHSHRTNYSLTKHRLVYDC